MSKTFDLDTYLKKVDETAAFLKAQYPEQLDYLVIVGSGLGALSDLLHQRTVFPYNDIPHFPQSTVAGHSGELHLGQIYQSHMMIMKGRFHMYEGYNPWDVVFPIRVAQKLGIKKLIITNAAGGINPYYDVADIMVIRDHMNWIHSKNPLIGPNTPWMGDRFPDMSDPYHAAWREKIKEIARNNKINVKEGVYLASTGPTYETKAEIEMFRTIGADAVGMSTIPEVMAAVNGGFKILGLSYISNVHLIGVPYTTSHEEVMENSKKVTDKMITLITDFVQETS